MAPPVPLERGIALVGGRRFPAVLFPPGPPSFGALGSPYCWVNLFGGWPRRRLRRVHGRSGPAFRKMPTGRRPKTLTAEPGHHGPVVCKASVDHLGLLPKWEERAASPYCGQARLAGTLNKGGFVNIAEGTKVDSRTVLDHGREARTMGGVGVYVPTNHPVAVPPSRSCDGFLDHRGGVVQRSAAPVPIRVAVHRHNQQGSAQPAGAGVHHGSLPAASSRDGPAGYQQGGNTALYGCNGHPSGGSTPIFGGRRSPNGTPAAWPKSQVHLANVLIIVLSFLHKHN